jgi:penicillin-binding protein 1B
MNRNRLKKIAIIVASITAFALVFLVVWIVQLNSEIKERISSGWFVPPVEIYTDNLKFSVGAVVPRAQLQLRLQEKRYRERSEGETLREKDYAWLDQAQCVGLLDSLKIESGDEPSTSDIAQCLMLHSEKLDSGPVREANLMIVALSAENAVLSTVVTKAEQASWRSVAKVELPPDLFAQFYGDEPLLRQIVRIGEVPLQCSQAVTAIEDGNFLNHSGVSFTGLMRAFMTNMFAGRYAQGGSTITQQLVKNYFLTPEKNLKRKITEIFMAMLLEADVDKDQILENYLNVIYMGQNGPFQIRGFAAASDYYFSRPLSELNLSDCALLAAIINSPGRYSPFTNPDRARERRKLVLEKMKQYQMIDDSQMQEALAAELPKAIKKTLSDPAPYFIQAVFRYLSDVGIDRENSQGLRIYTTLVPAAQDLAQKMVTANINQLEKDNKKVRALKEKGLNLEMSLISADIATGGVNALVGGRQYLKTQYNRVLDAKRQVGSVMKPFVYLAAFEGQQPDGEPYTPLSLIEDKPFTHKYEGQNWSPKNYTKKTYGPVPLFYALKNSLNISTAKLGLAIGLDNIIDVAQRAGVTSEMKAFPSLTLGAFEIHQWEIAQAYTTIARMGEKLPLHTVHLVEDLNGGELYKLQSEPSRMLNAEATAKLIGMMKQNLKTGTGRLATLRGFDRPAAGKTGTTSDTKDAWYVGFTPHTLTVTWAGYDDNTPSGLTGASGALPLWTDFMKGYTTLEAADDFKWPEGVSVKTISRDEIESLLPFGEDYEKVDTELVF